MKKLTRLFAILAALMMVMACTATSFATLPEKGYDYTIKVYAGNEGKFVKSDDTIGEISKDGKTLTITAKAGDKITIDNSTTGLTLNDNSDYYIRGFRIAGHDAGLGKGEVSNPAFTVDSDASYQASYGLKGGMVKYTVMYLDAKGNAVRNADEYYGMVGDKPVVSYKYIEGYQPNAYNITKTLVADESQNVFGFSYLANTKSSASDDGDDDEDAADNAGTNRNNDSTANANGSADTNQALADAAEDAQNNEPAEVIDLDDNDTPLADAPDSADGEATDSGSGVSPVTIGIGALAVAAAAIAAVAIKRRRDEEYEEDEE